jgi:response regulator RpfG family c-di-GMP phosphodiesterase
MPGVNGMSVLAELRPENAALPILVLTANGSVSTVVQAMQAGANDFIVKPASPERLQVSIQNALKMNVLAGEISRLSRKTENRLLFTDLIARSLVMRQSIMLSLRIWSSRSCSVTKKARSPARRRRKSASSKRPTAARCSSMKWASCLRRCRSNCCAPFKRAKLILLAARSPSKSIFV